MEWKNLDLNLLRVLAELIREKSVSRAAVNLGMTQPGMSNALNRLRKLLGDELLLRTGRGMRPTPYAERITETLNDVMQQLQDTLNIQMDFDPLTSTRKFTIAMTDIGEIDFLSGLMRTLETSAPGVSISTVRRGDRSLKDDLETGATDLAVGWQPDLNTGIYQRRLTGSQYVCAFRKGHALDTGHLTVDAFSTADHLVVVAGNTGHMLVQRELERLNLRRNVKLQIPHFAAVGAILRETNLISTLPLRLVRRSAEPFNLSWAPLPVPVEPIPLNIFWSAKYHRDPGNQWLRRLMIEMFADDSSRP